MDISKITLFNKKNIVDPTYMVSEDTVLKVYKESDAVSRFSEKAYNYAKAVACLRLISVYKVSIYINV